MSGILSFGLILFPKQSDNDRNSNKISKEDDYPVDIAYAKTIFKVPLIWIKYNYLYSRADDSKAYPWTDFNSVYTIDEEKAYTLTLYNGYKENQSFGYCILAVIDMQEGTLIGEMIYPEFKWTKAQSIQVFEDTVYTLFGANAEDTFFIKYDLKPDKNTGMNTKNMKVIF